ncbi:MAG: ATP-dependent dethiobiotin synthetase BioD 1 [Myxococcota bacterium]|nr:ATP-dependent dethiobiotin synthetase BioD 1 [Myxococcota bacterium]
MTASRSRIQLPAGCRGLMVSATGTGVGKTHVSTLLAKALRERGVPIGVIKPIETGCALRDGELFPADGDALRLAAGERQTLDEACPLRFALPAAPWVSARYEGTAINPENVLSSIRRVMQRHPFTIVEGAGGLLVPISAGFDMVDIARRLNLPVLLVARARLGTINDARLGVEACRSRGVTAAGVILNQNEPPTGGDHPYVLKSNGWIIEQTTGAPILAELPWNQPAECLARLSPIAGEIHGLAAGGPE